jgi:hypothetical protein
MTPEEQADLELAIKMSRLETGGSGSQGQRHQGSSSSQHAGSSGYEREHRGSSSSRHTGSSSRKTEHHRSSSSRHTGSNSHEREHRRSSSSQHTGSSGRERKHHQSSSSRHAESNSLERSSTAKPTSSESSSGRGIPSDVKYDISSLKELYYNYTGTVCRKCKAPVGTKVDIKEHVDKWSRSSRERSICSTTCSKCSASTCLGCGQKPRVGVNFRKMEYGAVDWCCDGGRLVGVWILMAKYDETHLEVEARLRSRHSENDSHRRSNAKGNGVGYVEQPFLLNHNPFVPVYDESYGLASGATATEAIEFQQSDSMIDGVLKRILYSLCVLLPDPKMPSDFDESPPIAIRAVFRLGLLLDKIAELLRNDSVNDISARASLYTGAFRLVLKLVSHRGTSSIVTEERHWKTHTGGLQAIARDKGGSISLSGTRSSLASLAQGLIKQSQIILTSPREFESGFGRVTLDLCTEAATLNSMIESIGGKTPTSNRQPQKRGDEWARFHKNNGVVATNDMPGDYYYFLDSLLSLHRSPKGRIPRIIKEIAEMTTGAPPGILIRVSPDRPDAMKALIIGPDDSPYAGGLFE